MIVRLNIQIAHQTMPDHGVNTWHWRGDGEAEPPRSDLTEAIGALAEFYVALTDTPLAQGAAYTFDGTVTTVEAEPQVFDAGGSWAAGNAGSSQTLPPANCIVLGWGTQSATRRGRGRTFLGPIQSAVNEANGTPSAASLTAIRNAADDLLAFNAGEGNGAFGVYSRVDNVFRDFTSRTVHDKFAVLRSRRD